MTIIASWINKENITSPNLWTITDSRLSTQNGMPLLNCGAKLFSIRIICLKPGISGFFTDIYFSTTIGIAFSGSSLMGLSLFAFLSHTLGTLIDPQGCAKPSIEEIAIHANAVLEQLLANHIETNMNPAPCEVSIFGSCNQTGKYLLFHITQTQSHPPIALKITEIDLNENESVHLMGNFKAEINQEIFNHRSSQIKKDISWWRSPKTVIQDIINNNRYDTIGGGIQIGITYPNPIGFQAHAVCKPIELGRPAATLFYQNIDLSANPNLKFVGNCMVGVTSMI